MAESGNESGNESGDECLVVSLCASPPSLPFCVCVCVCMHVGVQIFCHHCTCFEGALKYKDNKMERVCQTCYETLKQQGKVTLSFGHPPSHI